MTVLTVLITLLYPLAIWLGQGKLEPRLMSVLLLLAALTRLPTLKVSKIGRWLMAGALVLVALTAWSNQLLPLKLYPFLMNVLALVLFAYSLFYPPSMVERIARITEPDLPPEAIGYTRRVTQVWCGFFIINGSIALYTTLWASQEVWSLYNGVIAYLLMGVMFGGEYLIRLRFRRRHGG
ncbi:MAG: hypothetical protein ACXWJD_08050 [Burkholderiaceae bacterium]